MFNFLSKAFVPIDYSKSRDLDISDIRKRMEHFRRFIEGLKAGIKPDGWDWYPYKSLMNFYPLEAILRGENRALISKVADSPVLDLGCGDGDLSFFLEALGCAVHAGDYPPTNFNGMRGVNALRDALNSKVHVFEANLDDRFSLPALRYGLAFFCGTLYHLKNPFYVLEALARSATYCVLSTRVARQSSDGKMDFQYQPIAYLLDATEANNDPTNYWIFSEGGLRRILDRAGWDLLDYGTTGDTRKSNPSDDKADERAFCFLRSRCL